MKISTNAGRALGDLEKDVMDLIWQKGATPIKEVVDELRKDRVIAYTTVLTIMNRLVEKAILKRTLSGSAYIYEPKVDKNRFLAQATHQIFATAISTLGQEAVAHFVQEIKKLSPSKRRELLEALENE